MRGFYPFCCFYLPLEWTKALLYLPLLLNFHFRISKKKRTLWEVLLHLAYWWENAEKETWSKQMFSHTTNAFLCCLINSQVDNCAGTRRCATHTHTRTRKWRGGDRMNWKLLQTAHLKCLAYNWKINKLRNCPQRIYMNMWQGLRWVPADINHARQQPTSLHCNMLFYTSTPF